MSLALLGGYSSAEDDEPAAGAGPELSESGGSSAKESGSDGDEASARPKPASKPRRRPNPRSGDAAAGGGGGGEDSSLPSALEAFADISGPPDFLRHRVAEPEEATEALGVLDRRGKEGSNKPPRGAVVVAKPQIVAIHERVTVTANGANPPGSVTSSSVDGKRVIGAANPGPEDAADLLRMCLQCGVPKTYSHAKGMVCPICSDRPAEAKEPEKKKGSTVKDKEKVKRMRGQSSHASWKSETEMALRQQFD